MSAAKPYGQAVTWEPAKPRIRPLRLVLSWLVAAASLWLTAAGVPGVAIGGAGAALGVALGIAVINAVLPPVLAALRLPFMVGIGFVLVLFANAFALELASDAAPTALHVNGFGDALLAALVVTAVSLVIQVALGTNDDDEYSLRVTQRI